MIKDLKLLPNKGGAAAWKIQLSSTHHLGPASPLK